MKTKKSMRNSILWAAILFLSLSASQLGAQENPSDRDAFSDDPKTSALNFSNSLLGGLAKATNEAFAMHQRCLEAPDSEACVQRRLSQVRNVEQSMQMLNAIADSGALKKLESTKDLNSEVAEVQAINRMCTDEPNSFVCRLVTDIIASGIKKNSTATYSGAVLR